MNNLRKIIIKNDKIEKIMYNICGFYVKKEKNENLHGQIKGRKENG